ncbi:MAG: aldo/keto reductase [Alphaproteobacteria bacterium]|jgi:aryl-alcohol dehydrogenase-like predicted oxidoreductase|nr:aldo/keto reductase [Alphaproteobacteria bacterium]MDP6515394.1 aldo/keto reductase [Alphaproteobacteria bacterium]
MADERQHGPSRLILGTAQLGMAYGTANRDRMPGEARALALLDLAWRLGLTGLDTARDYGRAEQRIGVWTRRTGHRPWLISKVPPVTDGAAVGRQLAETENALAGARIDGLLAHRAEDLQIREVATAFRDLVAVGRIGGFGASVYSPEQARRALAVPGLSLVQVPLSIFDRRFADSGVLERAAAAGVALFARSVFLQGVIGLEPDALPAHLGVLAEPLGRLRQLADEADLAPTALALAAVLAQPEIASVVIGVDNPRQLRANVAAAAAPVDPAVIAEATALGCQVPEAMVDPSRW